MNGHGAPSVLDLLRAEVAKKASAVPPPAPVAAPAPAEPPHDPETGEIIEDPPVATTATTAPTPAEPRQWAPVSHARTGAVAAAPGARGKEPKNWQWADGPDGTRVRVPAPAKPKRARSPSSGAPTRTSSPRPWRFHVNEETGLRERVDMTDDEIEAMVAAKALAAEKLAEDRRVLAELIPVFSERTPAISERLIPGDKRTMGGVEALSLERPNGSKLRLVRRHYDGTGESGLRDIRYINAHVVYSKPNSGLVFRTRGCMFEETELREVANVLLAEADRLDAIAAESASEDAADDWEPVPPPDVDVGEDSPREPLDSLTASLDSDRLDSLDSDPHAKD